MISGSCLCGAVRFDYDGAPEKLVECNCSACRRFGGLWGHGALDKITIHAAPEATIAFSHGDKTLAFHTCATCGCTAYWAPLDTSAKDAYMAVNMRLCPPEDIAHLRIRRFDGADTWEFLD